MPSNEAKVQIVLTNTTDAPLSVTGTLAKKPHYIGNPQTFQLAAHETKILDLRQDFDDGNQFANSEIVALSFAHSAVKDALLARVMIKETSRGYSNVVQFSNPAGGKSSEYQGVGFQIEDVAGGEQMTPVIVARNVGNTNAVVTAKVPYTRIDGTRGSITLPQERLSSGEMRLLKIQDITQRVRQEQIKVASLEVAYDTVPGSVVVAAHTVSDNHNQVFRVPMWDPLGQRSPTGGYPWRIEGTSVTETYIKNITDTEEDFVAFLVWENGGMYMIGMKPIAGHETIHIDVKKLRDEQIPDERGRTIPLSVSSGQLQWTLRRADNLPDADVRANLALIGRSEQVDTTKGIVNNYSCQNCCTGNFVDGRIEPDDLNPIEVGSSRQYRAIEYFQTCYGYTYGLILSRERFANWNTFDANIASVVSGNVTGVNAGNTGLVATWTIRQYDVEPCNPPTPFSIEADDEKQCEPAKKDAQNEIAQKRVSKSGDTSNFAECGTCVSHSSSFSTFVTVLVKPKITINRDGSPITSTQDVIVGQRINLSATVVGGTPSSQQWTIPEKAIDKFETLDSNGNADNSRTPAIGRPASIPSSKLTSNQVDFIWHNGGSNDIRKQVQYTVTVNGISSTATAVFDVQRPTAALSSVGGTTKVDNSTPNLYLGGVTNADVGIIITRGTTAIPNGFSGDFQFVQLISGQVIRSPVGGQPVTTLIPAGLDGCYPYALNQQSSINDTPGFLLATRGYVFEYGEYDAHWNTYLMFKPTGNNSDWVPITRLDWAWHGSATLDPNSLQWTPNDISPPGNPNGTDTTDYPTWNRVQPNASGPCIN